MNKPLCVFTRVVALILSLSLWVGAAVTAQATTLFYNPQDASWDFTIGDGIEVVEGPFSAADGEYATWNASISASSIDGVFGMAIVNGSSNIGFFLEFYDNNSNGEIDGISFSVGEKVGPEVTFLEILSRDSNPSTGLIFESTSFVATDPTTNDNFTVELAEPVGEPQPHAVPIPASAILFLSGLGLLVLRRKKIAG